MPSCLHRPILLALGVVCAGVAALAQGPGPAAVTPEILAGRIAEVEAAADLPDETRAKLLENYRKASSSLEEARAHEARAVAFEEAVQIAPAQTELARAELAGLEGVDPLEAIDVGLADAREQVEQRLTKEKADLAAAAARRAEIERRLTYEQDRVSAIGPRLADTKRQQEEAAASLRLAPEIEESPALSQARRWLLEARYAALAAEIRMLEQELLSLPMRMDLLAAQRDREAAGIARMGTRIEALDELVNVKRRDEAERAKAEAAAARQEVADLHPVLLRLFDENTELIDEMGAMAERLDTLDREQGQAEKLAARIAADLESAKTALESVVEAKGLGRLLLEQRESLPDIQLSRRRVLDHEQQIAAAMAQRLDHQAEARRLADPDRAFAQFDAQLSQEATGEPLPEARAKLAELLENRRLLLDQVLEADEFYLGQLQELEAAERRLLDVAGAYEAFLDKNLLWLRSAEPSRPGDLADLPGEARSLASPEIWGGLAGVFLERIRRPAWWIALLVAALLLWKHRATVSAIRATSELLRKPTTDSFGHTARALALTLAAAAPLPLLLAAIGWQLQAASSGTDLSHAVGLTLLRVALHLYVLLALRAVCLTRGLAVSHLRWPEPSAWLLRRELGWLAWILVPLVLVVRLAVDLNPVETGGTIARLGFLAYGVALALFFYRVFHPQRGVLAPLRPRLKDALLFRTYRLWFPLLLAFPLVMAGMALAGYIYSADNLYYLFQHSLWYLVALIVLYALGLRWLRVVNRRLTYEAALERRQAALAAGDAAAAEGGGEVDALQVEEPEADVAALSTESRGLLKIAIVFLGLFGLFLIWSPLLPALGIFEDVTLWHHTATVDGEEKRLPITLADLGLAILYGLGTGVLARRLPAVLEMILLRRTGLSAGSRYTATTLTRYAIVAVGVLLVFNTLGAQWSQFQWMAAALSVGIGFGLQEIVANFISGLIMLFERPVRIGDVITIGDTSGVVTRIQGRATTIRDWDRKELLVPNKEFITGRLLNWSLSDEVIRIVIRVGVAYGSDVDQALALMGEAAAEHERVLDDPAPMLVFEGFGPGSLDLALRVYLPSVDRMTATATELRNAIKDKFEQAGIIIAFPQADLHLDSLEPLRISLASDESAK